jgi:hypothetical protein
MQIDKGQFCGVVRVNVLLEVFDAELRRGEYEMESET